MRNYLRSIRGWVKFAQGHMTSEEALALSTQALRERILAREENFLSFVGGGIFGNPKSPYAKLLAAKHIAFDDLQAWINRDGLEVALTTLAQEGVYFTVDEFKGRIPVERNGVSFRCHERSFDNPFLSDAYEVRSGGTRSAGTRIRTSFEYLHQRSMYDVMLLAQHGCLQKPVANWFPLFPAAPGINASLRYAHIGNPVQRWFSQISPDRVKVGWKGRVRARALFVVSRMFGAPLAEPEYVELGEAIKVARWVAQTLQDHDRCVVYTFAGSAVRVCLAAQEAGLNIEGARFFVTGEPLTPQKRFEIESTGAYAVPVYGISEAGVVGTGCGTPHEASDQCHHYKGLTAVITQKHYVPRASVTLDAFLFTSLLQVAPKVLLNVGMGDYGKISPLHCDCGFTQLGFDTGISEIRSYEKMTGEGVTFVETDFLRIIERELPQTFGGSSTDYQLVEEEDEHGLARLRLRVSERLGAINEQDVLDKFLDLMHGSEDRGWAQPGPELWRQSGTVKVERASPITTSVGKIFPFYLQKKPEVEVQRAG